ncbi:LLM class flavin-dependent oxidoreductase [Kineococcus rhizosphaerae]|uniref:Alkanesulfonate monooxygenase SsuD/methylene tetrahydromethanopterin reductase-like flavin-dependent oxidoreductase (Luciferase family) n=1 Tax=Kineococcus rhizosphaerae TaxID=559628 RepID=A0A2T0R189_9ACTN|nr:LLM class flavin-dependent oxidoreductase [Kineococcus rhizosphaerae]PRY13058.1 alkanesulfonate monooxygenase SsuD/methylene tetrahydromethanopterin reductase-like flavin-dependent oxidoreductase (luciferase family) [Kineococcus rhizosphaerae]
MKFLVMTLIGTSGDAAAGRLTPPRQRFREVVETAEFVEELGLDAFGVGERHSPEFLSSSPTVVLSHLAARTSTIRLFTTVTVLSLLDPVRVAEDYATLDHLSDGRVEIVIGKGNDAHQSELFGFDLADQWDRNRENYELLHRLWREEKVSWSGRYRPDLVAATTYPRPLAGPPRVWHGSASSTESTELAARYGEPLFSANAFHPQAKYADLIAHYRQRFAEHGHDPARALVGAGSGGVHLARTSQEAVARFRPLWEAYMATPAAAHNRSPFTSLEDALDRGPNLVGSPAQVVDKIGDYHGAFGHELLAIGVDGQGLDPAEQRATLELFAGEVAPVVRREFPSRSWEEFPRPTLEP